eukprot:gene15325-21409_t
MSNKLEAIRYERGKLALLDQRLLPFETTYLDVPTPQSAWAHIKDMVVRGAPAIGVTGALAMAVDLTVNKSAGTALGSLAEAVEYINTTLDYLVTSRPTAVNLADSAIKLKALTKKTADAEGCTTTSLVLAVVLAAESMLAEDILANRAMGAYGSAALLEEALSRGRSLGGRVRVLTHCNTGSLATAGFGTALGVMRALHEQGKLEHAYCCETRPYNQGARLTAFELVHDGLPATLICDLAAASLMQSGQIGTYSLSIVAAHHNIPFFIAAPTTTLDATTPDGAQIVIEQRPAEEVTHFKGQRVVVEGIKIYNPCFDVAPAKLITGIITEKGLYVCQYPNWSEAGNHGINWAMRDILPSLQLGPTFDSASDEPARRFVQEEGQGGPDEILWGPAGPEGAKPKATTRRVVQEEGAGGPDEILWGAGGAKPKAMARRAVQEEGKGGPGGSNRRGPGRAKPKAAARRAEREEGEGGDRTNTSSHPDVIVLNMCAWWNPGRYTEGGTNATLEAMVEAMVKSTSAIFEYGALMRERLTADASINLDAAARDYGWEVYDIRSLVRAAANQNLTITWTPTSVHFVPLAYETMNDMLLNILCPSHHLGLSSSH